MAVEKWNTGLGSTKRIPFKENKTYSDLGALLSFLGFPTKIDYRKKGTHILTFLLEDLVMGSTHFGTDELPLSNPLCR